MQHSNDIDPVIDRHVENNVPPKWKTQAIVDLATRRMRALFFTVSASQVSLGPLARLFKRPFPSPRHPALGSVGRNTANVALESAFGCRLRSAGDLSGAEGPAKMRLPLVPSTGYRLPSGRLRRSPNHSDAADSTGPGRRVA